MTATRKVSTRAEYARPVEVDQPKLAGGAYLYKVEGPIDPLELKRAIVKALEEDRFKQARARWLNESPA